MNPSKDINKTAKKAQSALGCQPKYGVIYRAVLADVRAGVYAPGDRLPSVRTLAARYGFQRGIALHALTRLAREGVLCPAAKSGFYVNSAFNAKRTGVIGFFLNEACPLDYGEVMGAVRKCILLRGYKPLYGSNFHNVSTLAYFLHNNSMDGLLLAGKVDESVMTQLHGTDIPCVVLGNHSISPRHLQARYPESKPVETAFSEALQPFRGKSGAILSKGQTSFRQALLQVFSANGIQCTDVMTGAKCDVLCICPECVDAFRAECRRQGRVKECVTVCQAFPFQPGDDDFFDISVPVSPCDSSCAESGVKMLVDLLLKR